MLDTNEIEETTSLEENADDNQETIEPAGEVVADDTNSKEAATETQANQDSEAAQETSQEKNFRQLREAKERAERERDEALSALQQQPQQQYYDPYPSPEPYYEPEEKISVADDDLVEGKHLNKLTKKINQLEQDLYYSQQRTSEASTEALLKSKYSDFESVVTESNLRALRSVEPELADSLNANPDLYKKAVSAYKLIKKLGINAQDPYKKNKEIAQKNTAKPRPLTSMSAQQGDSPLSRANAFANGLTDELKENLRKEMEEARKAL